MSTSWHSQTLHGTRFDWRPGPGASFDVKVWWDGGLIVAATLNGAGAQLPFSASTEDGHRHIAGLLESLPGNGINGELLLRYLRYDGGEDANVRLWPPGPPPPPPQPGDDPPPAETDVRITGEAEHDLFPYVYMRPWPGVSEADRENRFVSYERICEEGSDVLYCRLLREKTDRTALEREAVAFIDGAPPYTGQFLQTIRHLQGPIAHFAHIDAELRTRAVVTLHDLKATLEQHLGMTWAQIAEYLTTDPSYAIQRDRAWQNLFALVIVLGFDHRLLEDLIRTLVLARLAERVVRVVPEDEVRWPPSRVKDGVWATIVLPEAIFPLPPANPEPPRAMTERTRLAGATLDALRAYAIGDLQLVRQRLLRYELGEVSAIENVMPGESRETTRRALSRHAETTSEETTGQQAQDTVLLGTRAELAAETEKTLALDFKLTDTTTYGPPAEGEAVSSIVVAPNADPASPQARTVDRATEFARRVTARTAGRLARTVRRRRIVATLDESESSVVSRFDASGATAARRGIYRWVNKVYEAHVVSYGRRLMVEAFLRDPARLYISGEESLQGVSLTAPVSPADLGIATFRDVSRDPESPGYFASLAALYDARGITPPPPDVTTTGAAFQAGVDVHVQELAVPDGYRARRAFVTASWPDPGSGGEAYGVVGRAPFRIASDAAQKTVEVPLGDESRAIPVAFGCRDSVDAAAAGVPGCLASVEVESRLGERLYEEWQIGTYDAIQRAYQRQRETYLAAAGASPGRTATRNPLSSREVVREQLQRGVMRELARLIVRHTGEPQELLLGEPRYVQFFEQAFEWREMAMSFTVRTGESPATQAVQRLAGEEQLFTAFLQAGFARVLLPVRPGHEYAVPYLLASGMLWDGVDALAPANETSVALLNDLKTAAHDIHGAPPRSEPWTVRVPTSMVLLQDGPDLPGLMVTRPR